MAVPTLTYEAEILTVTEKQEAKIENAKVEILRSIAGYTRNDRIRYCHDLCV
jgi:hypothetical protein